MRHTKSALRCLAVALIFAMAVPVRVAPAAEVKTSKERLSDKATDDQRVDNCRVPPERQGPKPRPGCPDGTRAGGPAAGKDLSESSNQR